MFMKTTLEPMKPTRPKKETRRDAILAYIVTYASDHKGNSPSLGEMSLHFKISRQTVYNHTKHLEDEGRIRWQDGKLCLPVAEFSCPLTL